MSSSQVKRIEFLDFAKGFSPGVYTVTENDPPGYVSVADAEGINDNLITITLISGDNVGDQDFLDGISPEPDQSSIYLPIIFKGSQTN